MKANDMVKEMLDEIVMEMLNEKVDEIFLAVQERTGIQHGDIAPWDAVELNLRMDALADIIAQISEWQYRNDATECK